MKISHRAQPGVIIELSEEVARRTVKTYLATKKGVDSWLWAGESQGASEGDESTTVEAMEAMDPSESVTGRSNVGDNVTYVKSQRKWVCRLCQTRRKTLSAIMCHSKVHALHGALLAGLADAHHDTSSGPSEERHVKSGNDDTIPTAVVSTTGPPSSTHPDSSRGSVCSNVNKRSACKTSTAVSVNSNVGGVTSVGVNSSVGGVTSVCINSIVGGANTVGVSKEPCYESGVAFSDGTAVSSVKKSVERKQASKKRYGGLKITIIP